MTARWLTDEFVTELTRLDETLWGMRKTGSITITVHYRGGRPLRALACEVVQPSALIEVSLRGCASTS